MVAALLLLLFLAPLHAQVNIETYRGKRGVTGAARLALSSDVGNIDVVKGEGSGHITVNTARGVLLGVCKGGVGFLGGERFANSGVLHLRWTATASPRWQPEFFAQTDYAKSRRLDNRALVGTGMRYNAYAAEKSALSLGAALLWELEDLNLAPGDPHPATTQLMRLSSYINLSLQGRVGFATTAYVQPALSDLSDVRLLGTTELTTPIVGPLRQTTTLDFRIDSAPPRGVEKKDIKFGTSFGVEF